MKITLPERDRESSPLGPRLHLARRKAGLSLRALADATDGVISHASIRQVENGERWPEPIILEALCLALGVSPRSLLAPLDIALGEIEFRKVARTTAADRQAVREEILELLERYLEIEDILEMDEQWSAPALSVASSNQDESYPEDMARALREEWKLGIEPIHDFTKMLEEKGLKVLLPRASVTISGLTCEVHRLGRPSVFVAVANREHSLERRRFTLAHELGHRVLDFEGLNGKMAESVCNQFAGAFLVPKETLERELGEHQRTPTYRELMMTKRFFRVSAAMLVLRLKQVGIMDVAARDRFFKTIGKNWRTDEPEPLEEKPSGGRANPLTNLEPPRFERLVYRALGMDYISAGKAAELLHVGIREVKRNIDGGGAD